LRPVSYKVLIPCVAAAVVLLSACGRDQTDLVNGKTLFVQKCGACHTMARAGTKGVQGPNLDHAFAAARKAGMNSKTIEGITERQIAYPLRNSIMPPGLVKGQDAKDVAAYVAFAAGMPGKDTGELAQAGAAKTGKPVVAKNGKADIIAPGGLAFSTSEIIATPGELTIALLNKDAIGHNVAIKGGGIDEKGAVVPTGGKSEVSGTLEAGVFTFYCSVPGHEAGGMKGKLTVK
jgi:plastocyanin